MDVKSINIDDIGLSVRASNCLHRVGVHTVGDMLTYTEESLQEIRNLGKKTLAEILQKIEDYKKHSEEAGFPDSTYPASAPLPEMPEDFTAWSVSDEGREFILSWLREQDAGITELELLSAKAYNRLLLHQYLKLDQIIFLSAEDLMNIPWMDLTSAEEIVRMCRLYLKDHEADILECLKKKKDKAQKKSFWQGVKAEFRKIIWVDRPTVIKQTTVVVVVTAILAAVISVFDAGILQGINLLLG